MPTVEFILNAFVEHENDFVGVVGNHAEIGEWNFRNGKKLVKDADSNIWRIKVEFTNASEIEYRYFVGCTIFPNQSEKHTIVQKWESGPKKYVRKASIPHGNKTVTFVDGDFGVINENECEDCGWLSMGSEVRLTFSHNGEAPMISQHGRDLCEESLAVSFKPCDEIIDCNAKLIKPDEYCNLALIKTPLPGNDEVLTFITQVIDLSSFHGTFCVYRQDDSIFGYASISGALLQQSVFYLKLAIVDGDNNTIGTLSLESVVIKSYENQGLLTMQEGFCNYWKKRPTLHIGHRGCGNSFSAKIPSDIYENTLKSFRTASEHQAAMIEFDVQLTKDEIPIVFHDFTICTSVVSKQGSKQSLLEVEVQSLTHDELNDYKLRHRTRKSTCKQPVFDEDSYDMELRPFLTLQEVLEKVPEHTGFDIELKWPEYNLDKTYSHGVKQFCDANKYVDKILDVVLKYCNKRRIVFSTFDANICIFLRRKQNRFPVIYLMDEGSTFMDLRSRYNKLAIPFSVSENFIGICFSEDSAFSDENFIRRVQEQNLLCLFYGDRIAEEKNREMLCRRGADGIIYDRIHQVLPKGPNIFQSNGTA